MVEMTDIGLLLYDAKEYYARFRCTGRNAELRYSSHRFFRKLVERANQARRSGSTWIGSSTPCRLYQQSKQSKSNGSSNQQAIHGRGQVQTPSRGLALFNETYSVEREAITFGSAQQRRRIGIATVPKKMQPIWRFASPGMLRNRLACYIDLQVESRIRYGLTTQRWHEIIGRRDDPSVLSQRSGTSPQLQGVLIRCRLIRQSSS